MGKSILVSIVIFSLNFMDRMWRSRQFGVPVNGKRDAWTKTLWKESPVVLVPTFKSRKEKNQNAVVSIVGAT